jgi:hypothetical protein
MGRRERLHKADHRHQQSSSQAQWMDVTSRDLGILLHERREITRGNFRGLCRVTFGVFPCIEVPPTPRSWGLSCTGDGHPGKCSAKTRAFFKEGAI